MTKKTILKISTLIMMLCLPIIPAQAEESSPCIHMEVEYSEDIEPQKGDDFLITYCVKGNTGFAQIELDASTLVGKTGKIELDPAEYVITDVTYEGYNKEIVKQGYAITNTFSVTNKADEYDQFVLAIGETAGKKIVSLYEETLIKKGDMLVSSFDNVEGNGIVEIPSEEIEAGSNETAEQMANSDTEDQDDNEGSMESKNTDSDHPNQTRAAIEKSSPFKIVPLLIMGSAVAVTLFMLHKKGKI